MTLRFCPALPSDTKEILELNRQLIDRHEDLTAIDYDRVLNWVARNIETNLPHFRRILHGGNPVGYYCVTDSDKGTELDSFFVLPEYRSQGIGTEVLKHILNVAEGSVFLYVFRKNTRAIALYQRMGFEIAAEVGKTRYIMEHKKQDC